MGKRTKRNRHNSVAMAGMERQEVMFNIYAGNPYPTSPAYYTSTRVKNKIKLEANNKDDTSFESMTKLKNEYCPMLPSIHAQSPYQRPNFIKQNLSISNQVIRSYRSFSRRHAYNTRFEITEPSEDQTESHTFDMANHTISTKTNSSPKAKQNSRCKSQLSTKQHIIPEKVIQVKPIDGKTMLESIQETKESEQK